MAKISVKHGTCPGEPQVECGSHIKTITLQCAGDVFMMTIPPEFLRIISVILILYSFPHKYLCFSLIICSNFWFRKYNDYRYNEANETRAIGM